MGHNKIIFELGKFYKEKDTAVHIKLNNGNWANGFITFIESDRLIIDEETFGEMLILFEQIKEDGILPREEKR